MTGSKAVTAVWKVLNEALGSETLRIFKSWKQEDWRGEYISLHSLPFVIDGPVEKGIVNANIHVPKTATNEPDITRMDELVERVIELFPQYTLIDGAYYEYLCDSNPVADSDGTFYINTKINVRYNNLKS